MLLNLTLVGLAVSIGQFVPSRQIAFTAYDRQETNALMLMDVGRNLTVRYPFAEVITELNWLPDGETLLITASQGFSLTTAQWQHGRFFEHKIVEDRRFAFLWSPDYSQVAFSRVDETEVGLNINLYLGSSINGQARRITRSANADEQSLIWSPDGSCLIYQVLPHAAPTRWRIYNVATRESSSFANRVQGGDWSPDGRTIAYTTATAIHRLILYDVATKKIRELEVSEPDETLSPQWSPAGDTLSFTMGDAIYLIDVEDGQWRRISDTLFYAYMPVWSVDGEAIVHFAGSGIRNLVLVEPLDQAYTGLPPRSRLLYANVQGTIPAWRP